MGTPNDSKKTRASLIEAAGQLFAERGFNGVTVRDIVKQAETHLSALNYHFRSKEALYREVVLEACRADSISLKDQQLLLRLDPHRALGILVKESLTAYARQTAKSWQTVVITRECREPSEVFTEVVREYFSPELDFVAGIIGRIVDRAPESQAVRFAVVGMIGLVETFGLYGHLIDAVAPALSRQIGKGDLLTERITHLVVEAAKTFPGE